MAERGERRVEVDLYVRAGQRKMSLGPSTVSICLQTLESPDKQS